MAIIETWKDIPGYENHYMVSDLGNVMSMKYNRKKLLKKQISKGRNVVPLSLKNKLKLWKVYQLVAMAFLNHKPDGTLNILVDHIDNNKSNDTLINLQLITNRENASKDKKGFTSKYIGVCWDKKYNKWLSQIRIGNKSKFLGYFSNELEASEAYRNKLAALN